MLIQLAGVEAGLGSAPLTSVRVNYDIAEASDEDANAAKIVELKNFDQRIALYWRMVRSDMEQKAAQSARNAPSLEDRGEAGPTGSGATQDAEEGGSVGRTNKPNPAPRKRFDPKNIGALLNRIPDPAGPSDGMNDAQENGNAR